MRRVVTAVCGVLVLMFVLACGGVPSAPVVNDMSLAEFKASRPAKPITMTLDCSLDGSREVAGKDCWRIMLRDPDTLAGEIASVEKENGVGKQAFGFVRDGKQHLLTVTVIASGEEVFITAIRRP